MARNHGITTARSIQRPLRNPTLLPETIVQYSLLNQSYEAFILLQCIPDHYFTKKRTLRNFEDYYNLIALNYLYCGKQASNTNFHLLSENFNPQKFGRKTKRNVTFFSFIKGSEPDEASVEYPLGVKPLNY